MGKQVQKMKMQLKLSPQQMMLMRLLQMPVATLEQAVEEELEKNPMLEMDRSDDEVLGQESTASPEDEDDELGRKVKEEAEFFSDDEDYYLGGGAFEDRDSRESLLASGSSMQDLLMEQLAMRELSDREQVLVAELIGSLSGDGYLARDLALIENDVAYQQDIECEEGEMERALQVLQVFEPAGVGARDLRECLLIQAKRLSPQTFESRCAIAVLDECFDWLCQHRYDAIVDALEIDQEALEGALACIRRLNPKPCASESADEPAAVEPDFSISIAEGHMRIELSHKHKPRLRLNAEYAGMLDEYAGMGTLSKADKETRDFLQQKCDAAKEFIDNIDTRREALEFAIGMIAKQQRRFLETGDPSDLKPLTQKEVAEMAGIDETVMSRIVNEKFVRTDFGTIPMKDLFAHVATQNSDGEDMASAAVRKVLGEVVEAEDKRCPLADEELAKAMLERGITLSRRTVAKYREQLGIPAAKLRKVLKVLALALCMGATALWAQTPMSYYDSLMYAREHKEAPASDNKVKVKQSAAKMDPALLRGEDLIEKTYDASRPLPSALWYGSKFSSSRVRSESSSIDSLPDEVVLRLVKGDGEFCFPVKNVITSPYGWRWERPHRGVDVALNVGDPVRCVFPGVVRIAKPMGAYGNLVVVRHFNGLESVYGHLSKIKVKPLQEVQAGDVLGLGGSTGRSTGPHLHFELRFQYEPFDPEWVLDFKNYTLRTKKLHLDKTYFGISKPRGRQTLAYKADKSYVKEEEHGKSKPKELYYTVKKGDKMAAIATQYKTTIDKIVELNPGFERLKPGLKLRVR